MLFVTRTLLFVLAILGGSLFSATPQFYGTPAPASALVGNADTSLTGPTTVTTVLTAAANGTKIEEIVVQGVGTTVAGVLNIFRYDGATYHLIDQVLVTAVTSSTTAVAFRRRLTYDNLILKTGDSLRASQTIAGNASLLKVTALANDAAAAAS